jgi:hypothetical protein
MTPEEFDELWDKEQYLVRHDWQRAPENGPGMWIKGDGYGGYDLMPLSLAYDTQLERDSVQ